MNKIFEKIKDIFTKTEDIMFPTNFCPFCECETLEGRVCDNCQKNFIKPNVCKKCGEHIQDNQDICMECKGENRVFDKSLSLVEYNNTTSPSIIKLKFNGAKYLAKCFAKLLSEKYTELGDKIDFVCAVPSHKNRIKKRGYNQAEEIAKEFCLLTGLVYANLLEKTKDTAHQTTLNRKDRLKNLTGTFKVTDSWLVKNNNILIIDDVFTTGSTLTACARALKSAKPNKIYCLTVAKTTLKL